MPNIAQQDYIIIDWGRKNSSDATKKAEVDAQLKNLYLANPLSLLSVLFKDYGAEGNVRAIVSWMLDDTDVSVATFDAEDGDAVIYTFSIA